MAYNFKDFEAQFPDDAAWSSSQFSRQGKLESPHVTEFVVGGRMTSEKYKTERKLRGTQSSVAALLGVRQATVSDRENGGEITREAWLALNALPKKRKKK
jgi:hypothetical protein